MKDYNICTIEDCEKTIRYKKRQLCQMHYFRYMRNGQYDLSDRSRHKRKDGYILITDRDHRLSSKNGMVFEHRAIAYQKYGNDLPPCEFCGKQSSWSSRNTHIDHIDNKRDNNKPENLRVLCNSCNVGRTEKTHHTYNHCTAITISGVTMTATEWSRHHGVSVSHNCILHRLRNGYSDYDAVYAKKITHNGNKKGDDQ